MSRISGTLLAFNKPFGVLCQFSPNHGKRTLADFIAIPHIYPAGRLDADSEGLLLLTDDGALQHRISDPKHKLTKTYLVQAENIPDEAALAKLRRGVELSDGVTRPAEAKRIAEPSWLWPRDPPIRQRTAIPTCWLELGICEGRNRQVRRMTAAVGHPTLRLLRVAIGPVSLESLKPGEYRAVEAGIFGS